MGTQLASYPDVLLVPEVAEVLRVNPAAVYELIRTKQLPAHKLGTGYRIYREHLRAFLEQ